MYVQTVKKIFVFLSTRGKCCDREGKTLSLFPNPRTVLPQSVQRAAHSYQVRSIRNTTKTQPTITVETRTPQHNKLTNNCKELRGGANSGVTRATYTSTQHTGSERQTVRVLLRKQSGENSAKQSGCYSANSPGKTPQKQPGYYSACM